MTPEMKNRHKIVYRNLDSAMRHVSHNGSLPNDGIETSDDDIDWRCSTAEEDYVADDDSFKTQKFFQLNWTTLSETNPTQKIKQSCWHQYTIRIIIFDRKMFNKHVFLLKARFAFAVTSVDFSNIYHKILILQRGVCLLTLQNEVFKTALIHYSNLKLSILIARSVHLHESYENVKILLHTIAYKRYSWKIYEGLKVIGMFVGMQSSFTKYFCLLCLWDNRATNSYYLESNWQRITYQPGISSIKNTLLVDQCNVLLPTLHIKIGMMKQFVKAQGKRNARGFEYIVEKYSCRTPN